MEEKSLWWRLRQQENKRRASEDGLSMDKIIKRNEENRRKKYLNKPNSLFYKNDRENKEKYNNKLDIKRDKINLFPSITNNKYRNDLQKEKSSNFKNKFLENRIYGEPDDKNVIMYKSASIRNPMSYSSD
tara:strand:- start:407 stop:796 length:390 start_codon:yes stop_codon:yes gene_type:complete